MVICKFYAQGSCRYGNNCWNEHIRPAGNPGANLTTANRFGALANVQTAPQETLATNNPYLNQANAASIVDEISKEMQVWEKSGMWPFSCFGFAKDVPCIPGFEDISPEEMRLKAYEAKASGNTSSYEAFWKSNIDETKVKLQTLRLPNPQLKQQMLEHVKSIQADAISKLSGGTSVGAATTMVGAATTMVGAGATMNVFASPITTTPNNPFGAVSTAPSIFGGATTTAFGSPTTTTAFGAPTTTTAFGAPATTTAFGAPATTTAFGAPATTSAPFGVASPGTFAMKASSPFGGAAPSVFGASAVASTATSTPSNVFGSAATPNLFGAASTAPMNLFGAPAAQTTTSIFGAATSTTSGFGGAPTMSLGFSTPSSQPQPNPVFGVPAAPVFGGTAGFQTAVSQGGSAFSTTTTASAFSNATSVTTSALSNIFGATPAVTTVAIPQPSISSPAPAASSKPPSMFPLLDGLDAFLPPTAMYTDFATLTDEEKQQFEAPEFLDLTKIPLRPPPKQFV